MTIPAFLPLSPSSADVPPWRTPSFFIKTELGLRNFVGSLNSKKTQSSVLSSFVSETGPSLYNISGGSHVQDAQYLKNSTGYVDNQHLSNGYSSNGSVYSGVRVGNGEISPCLVNLTQISSTSKVAIEGNVHHGLMQQKEITSILHGNQNRGRSKLNPKRVEAAWAERRKLELEMERRGERVCNNFDANWLPNFGTRKEFQTENKATEEADNQSEALMPVQPYISKRMRMIPSTSMSDPEAYCQENDGSLSR